MEKDDKFSIEQGPQEVASTIDQTLNEQTLTLSQEEEKQEDSAVCEVCLDGEVYEDNEIVFCEKCDIGVHQSCYGIDQIPTGSWFCNVCEAGGDPKTTTCELCSYKGGAYKLTDKPGKWVHPLCASWIPEVYFVVPKKPKLPFLNLSYLDKKRYKLRCTLCSTKGACVQCAHGRCTTGAHPWCVLKHPDGFTRRIVKGEDGQLLWEIFCRTHANSVTEPVKPKVKAKMSAPIPIANEDPEWNTGTRKSGGSSKPRLSMAHARKVNPFKGRGRSKKTSNTLSSDSESSDVDLTKDSDEDEDALGPSKGGLRGGKGKTAAGSSSRGTSNGGGAGGNSSTFPILNLLEWPGQSEGEGMDLDHFWNVVSCFYPEDHPKKWLEFMLKAFQDNEELSLLASTLKNSLEGIPPLGKIQDLEECDELTEELLSHIGGERERSAVFDPFKRQQLMSKLAGVSSTLGSHPQAPDEEDTNPFQQKLRVKLKAGTGTLITEGPQEEEKEEEVEGGGDDAFFMTDDEFLTKRRLPEETMGKERVLDETNTLKVVFDGTQRVSTNFLLKPVLTGESVIELREDQTKEKTSHVVNIQNISPSELEESDKWIENHLIPIKDRSNEQLNLEKLDLNQNLTAVEILLKAIQPLPGDTEVELPDRSIIPRDEDNTLVWALRADQRAFAALTHSIRSRLKTIMENHLKEDRSAVIPAKRREWLAVESRYLKQQMWKKICVSLSKGVQDQEADFNKASADQQLPASWTIQVQGRPKPEKAAEEPEENQEDAVCMCCFDGTSVEGNRILFCDGCNAVLHQACYGVSEIPEGDFFCDRCLHVQLLAKEQGTLDYHETRDAVMCCLCPLYHGGFKPTSDGRWVHLCCTMMTNSAVLGDLEEMSPVDLSLVPVQMEKKNKKKFTSMNEEEDEGLRQLTSDIEEPCVICNVLGGFVVRCCYTRPPLSEGQPEVRCPQVFHPVCAWFAGLYQKMDVTDPTFEGKDREGKYPSGMKFTFFCDGHSRLERGNNADAVKAEQLALRKKYRINEDDLGQIPGKNRQRRRKKPPKKRQSMGGSSRVTSSTSSAPVRDLAADVYDDRFCAACLQPFSKDVFGCGYDGSLLAEKEEDLAEMAAAKTESAIMEVQAQTSMTPQENFSNSSNIIQTTTNDLGMKWEAQNVFQHLLNAVGIVTAPIAASPGVGKTSCLAGPISTPLGNSKLLLSGNVTASNNAMGGTSSFTPSEVLKCSKCALMVHRSCAALGTRGPSSTAEERSWRCAACVYRSTVLQQREKEHRVMVEQRNTLVRQMKERTEQQMQQQQFAQQQQYNQQLMQAQQQQQMIQRIEQQLFQLDIVMRSAEAHSPPERVQQVIQQKYMLQQQLDHLRSQEQQDLLQQQAQQQKSNLAQRLPLDRLKVIVEQIKAKQEQTHLPLQEQTRLQQQLRIVQGSIEEHYRNPLPLAPVVPQTLEAAVQEVPPLNTEVDMTCVFCPRRGGFFKQISLDNSSNGLSRRWTHLYCAQLCPGSVQVSPTDGTIDILAFPKDNRKQKCQICNRRSGVCVDCTYLGCSASFHPLCAARTGKAAVRDRFGEKQFFCFDHLPEGVEKLRSGYWVDGQEVWRLRHGLERARLILDILARREKYKRMLCKAETELFNLRFSRMLDKVKGRKHRQGDDVDLSDLSLYESDEEEGSEDEVLSSWQGAKSSGPMSPNAFVPLDSLQTVLPAKSADLACKLSTGEDVMVSGTWAKRGQVRLPKRISIAFAGVEVDRKEVKGMSGGQRTFMKRYSDMIQRMEDTLRPNTGIFQNAREEAEFGEELGPSLVRDMKLSDRAFKQAMLDSGATWLKVKIGREEVRAKEKPVRKVKVGYVVLDSEAEDETVNVEVAVEGGTTRSGRRHSMDNTEEEEAEKLSGSRGKRKSSSGIGRDRRRSLEPATDDQMVSPESDSKRGRGRPGKAKQGDEEEEDKEKERPSRSGRKVGVKGRNEVEEVVVVEEEIPPVAKRTRRGEVASVEKENKTEKTEKESNSVSNTGRKSRTGASAGGDGGLKGVLKTGDKSGTGRSSEGDKKRGRSSVELNLTKEGEETVQEEEEREKDKSGRSDRGKKKRTEVFEETPKKSDKKGKEKKDATVKDTLVGVEVQVKEVLRPAVFRTEAELETQLSEDQLLKFAVSAVTSKNENKTRRTIQPDNIIGFDAHFNKTQILDRVKSPGSWDLFPPEDLYLLEFQLQKFLKNLENITEDSNQGKKGESSVENRKKSNKRQKSPVKESNETQEESRPLFDEFSLESVGDLRDYKNYVRRVVGSESIRGFLRDHQYRSLNSFCRDFYLLMNNARNFSIPESLVWKDSAQLVSAFEQLKEDLDPRVTSSSSGDPENDKNQDKWIKTTLCADAGSIKKKDKSETEGENKQLCSCCGKMYIIQNWPEKFQIKPPYLSAEKITEIEKPFESSKNLADSTDRTWALTQFLETGSTEFQMPKDYVVDKTESWRRKKNRKTNFTAQWDSVISEFQHSGGWWVWLCPACVVEEGGFLVGRQVRVWWHDDAQWYEGQVNVFHDGSKTHRVLYKDKEWEFLRLDREFVIFSPEEDGLNRFM